MTSSPPPYSTAHVDNCALGAWYHQLKHVAIKSVIVDLPPEFVSVLLADGVTLPQAPVSSDVNEPEEDAVDDSVTSLSATQRRAIATVRARVEHVLDELGGKAFVKTKWSAPRDAAWMLGTLKCTSFDDVFLLLQASDFIVHDLTEPYAGCTLDSSNSDHETTRTRSGSYLVLKKWCNLLDSMLFRCFVVGHRLVAVSQRNCNEFFAFLVEQQEAFCDLLHAFYATNFRTRGGETFVFPDPDYSFDVYIDKRRRVYLLDINVFGSVTDTLLFSWEDLMEFQTEAPARPQDVEDEQHTIDFRVVESEQGIRTNPLSEYRAPTDLVQHLAGGAGFDAFIEQVKRDNATHGNNDQ